MCVILLLEVGAQIRAPQKRQSEERMRGVEEIIFASSLGRRAVRQVELSAQRLQPRRAGALIRIARRQICAWRDWRKLEAAISSKTDEDRA
jgi:hypothetical protein